QAALDVEQGKAGVLAGTPLVGAQSDSGVKRCFRWLPVRCTFGTRGPGTVCAVAADANPYLRPRGSQQLVGRDREVADASAGGVVDGVGDGGAGAGDADLADAAGAHGGVRVGDVGPDQVDLGDVEVDGDVVVGEARVHHAAGAVVEDELLGQGEADAHDDAAAELGGGGARVDD